LSTLKELFLKGRQLLKSLPRADLESKVLLLHSGGLTEQQFFSKPEMSLSQRAEKKFFRLVTKRLTQIPLAYITGEKEFWSLSFKVNPCVLIPRPETELLVETAIKLSSQATRLILDIGTGCGNVAVSIAHEISSVQIIATDISKRALKIAKMNAVRHKVANRITFVAGDLFSPVEDLEFEERFDCIISNPPYVSKDDWDRLPAEIKSHEPSKALIAGSTGLEFIQKLIRESSRYLKKKGYLIFEIGVGQTEALLKYLESGWHNVECWNDFSGIPRIISAQK
jgi:release factor glutamine methyltransferase